MKQDEKVAKVENEEEKKALEQKMKEMEANMNLNKATEANVGHAADYVTHLYSSGQAA